MRKPEGVLGLVVLSNLVEVEAQRARNARALEVLLVCVAGRVGHVPRHVEDGEVLLLARAKRAPSAMRSASERKSAASVGGDCQR